MKGSRRRFEIEATLIDTLVELREFNRASTMLEDLDQRQRLGRDKESVRLGLRCKLYLRQGKWQDAEQIWQSIEDKASPVHVALRAEILDQKIADLSTSPGARAVARSEVQSIRTKIEGPTISISTQADTEVAPELESDVDSD